MPCFDPFLSLISDFELMGGSTMERDVDARVALLTPADLTSVIAQLQIGTYCRDFFQISSNAQNFPSFNTRVIDLLSASIKIHSYSTIFRGRVWQTFKKLKKSSCDNSKL